MSRWSTLSSQARGDPRGLGTGSSFFNAVTVSELSILFIEPTIYPASSYVASMNKQLLTRSVLQRNVKPRVLLISSIPISVSSAFLRHRKIKQHSSLNLRTVNENFRISLRYRLQSYTLQWINEWESERKQRIALVNEWERDLPHSSAAAQPRAFGE